MIIVRRRKALPGWICLGSRSACMTDMEENMIAGKVVGSLVSTRKSEKLIGNKFMIVEPLRHMQADTRQIIAIDNIGAGIGEYVIVAQGSAARIGCDMEEAPVDAAIVGIIDDGGILEKDDVGME